MIVSNKLLHIVNWWRKLSENEANRVKVLVKMKSDIENDEDSRRSALLGYEIGLLQTQSHKI